MCHMRKFANFGYENIIYVIKRVYNRHKNNLVSTCAFSGSEGLFTAVPSVHVG